MTPPVETLVSAFKCRTESHAPALQMPSSQSPPISVVGSCARFQRPDVRSSFELSVPDTFSSFVYGIPQVSVMACTGPGVMA